MIGLLLQNRSIPWFEYFSSRTYPAPPKQLGQKLNRLRSKIAMVFRKPLVSARSQKGLMETFGHFCHVG